MRNKKEFKGSDIISEYKSANIKGATFNINEKTLKITFSSGAEYEYSEVPHEVFSGFDNADSQGKYFNTNISKKYNFKKI